MVEGKCAIVPTPKSAKVLIDRIEIIDERFLYFSDAKFVDVDSTLGEPGPYQPFTNKGSKIETFDREVDEIVDLIAKRTTVAEALKVYSEDVGDLPKVEFLCSLLVFLATRTVPQIIFTQLLLLRELGQAVIQRYALVLRFCSCLPGLHEFRMQESFELFPPGVHVAIRVAKKVLLDVLVKLAE
jgi:hypothetical protein